MVSGTPKRQGSKANVRSSRTARTRPSHVSSAGPAVEQARVPSSHASRKTWVSLTLLVVTFAVYFQVVGFGSVAYDDQDYINPAQVRQGLTWHGLTWAFTSGEAANWFPVTRLSHMLDFQLFGSRFGFHHLTSVFFHALAALLLFAFLNRSTGAPWRSALVAFLFALHPVHVESVAWIAERKDVLGAFFWFLTLWVYLRYMERPGLGRYALVLLSFSAGLMSKPMVVTLPFVLFLVDFWPLRRWRGAIQIWEKVPLLALSAASAIITFLVQQNGGSVAPANYRPFGLQIGNAILSYVVYIGQVFWPSKLALLYPFPAHVPAWEVLAATLALLSISAIVLLAYRGYPYLAFGWLWYLGTLVPVIGLVQVGIQAHADRYMYIPMTGLAIMLSWGAADVVRCWPRLKPAVIAFLATACTLAVIASWFQIRIWKDSESLFRHAIAVTEDNYEMHYTLGQTLSGMPGHLPEAIREFETALGIFPDMVEAQHGLGFALSQVPGREQEAISHYEAALRINPNFVGGHLGLAAALSKIPERVPEAITHYEAALRAKPDDAETHINLGAALSQFPDRVPEAITHYRAALRLKPNSVEAHNDLGIGLANIPGREQEAISNYQEAIRIDPNFMYAHYNLANLLARIPGRLPEAISEMEAAYRISPEPVVRQSLDRLRAFSASTTAR